MHVIKCKIVLTKILGKKCLNILFFKLLNKDPGYKLKGLTPPVPFFHAIIVRHPKQDGRT